MAELNIDDPLPFPLVHQASVLVIGICPCRTVKSETSRFCETLKFAVAHRITGRVVCNGRTLIHMPATLTRATKDSEDVNVARGDEIIVLTMVLSVMVVVVLDESVTKCFAVFVIERIPVTLILGTTFVI